MVYPLATAPTSREQLKEYCLRQLGDGVLGVEISAEQIDDAIDSALRWWWDYHFEGSEKIYFKYQIVDVDITNKYITLPQNIIGAVRIFDFTSSVRNDNIFNIRWQISMSDLFTYSFLSLDMVPYYMTIQHLQFLEQLLIGSQPIRFNRHQNKLYVDMDWARVIAGDFLIVEAYQVLDPDVYVSAWSDRWLLRYATALMKRQQGTNLKKHQNLPMPSGVIFNGQQIYNEAIQEIAEIEREVIHSYSIPCMDMIG